MKFAFILFKYFPFGGLQRDFLRIAEEALARGHEVEALTMQWEGAKHKDVPVHIFPKRGLQNHTQRKNFINAIQPLLQQNKYDAVLGFNKIPGLDVYYAADTCYQAKAKTQRAWFYRLTPRYRASVNFENDVFAKEHKTKILLLSELQQSEFEKFYQTPKERFYLLPPGIDKNRIAPDDAETIRKNQRRKFGLKNENILLMLVGSGFKTKGLDRAIKAMAALPKPLRMLCKLFVIGKDNPKPFIKLAKELNVLQQITFFGGRNDIRDLLISADLLVHPAYNENTGTVLLEALAAGTPVLTTDVCGYAKYILQAKAGCVIDSPFAQENLNKHLADMITSSSQATWRSNAINFAKRADIYNLPQKAVDILEL